MTGGVAVAILAGALGAAGGELRTPGDGAAAPVRVERQVHLMGTRASLVALAADRAQGLQLLERLLEALETVESELSTWRDDSALTAINRQPVGMLAPAPEPICELLRELAAWRRETAGAFDPAVGPLIDVWGLRDGGRWPAPDELARARRQAGLQHLAIRGAPCRVTRRRPTWLDAGGFGKGAALDRARARAAPGVPWMIDLGGQIAVGGGGGPWSVALAHPQRREEAALELALSSGSLSTSGGAERDVEVGGRRIGHVLDPRSGRPVSRDWTVTVWHQSALAADVLSTALYVMGESPGLAWAQARGIAACVLRPRGGDVEVRATRAFRQRFLVADAGPEGS